VEKYALKTYEIWRKKIKGEACCFELSDLCFKLAANVGTQSPARGLQEGREGGYFDI
jgi:hypothetical protein